MQARDDEGSCAGGENRWRFSQRVADVRNETQTGAHGGLFQRNASLKDISMWVYVHLTNHGSWCLFQFFHGQTLCSMAYNYRFTGIWSKPWESPSPSLNTRNTFMTTRIFTAFIKCQEQCQEIYITHLNCCHTQDFTNLLMLCSFLRSFLCCLPPIYWLFLNFKFQSTLILWGIDSLI